MAEETLQKPIVLPKISLEYPPFAGKPASSENNWVLIDFLNAKLAKVFGVEDEKTKE